MPIILLCNECVNHYLRVLLLSLLLFYSMLSVVESVFCRSSCAISTTLDYELNRFFKFLGKIYFVISFILRFGYFLSFRQMQ
jgi:hypothetical protein